MRWMLDHPERRQSFAVVLAAVLSWSLRDVDPSSLAGAAESLGISTAMLAALLVICVTLVVSSLLFFVFAGAATVAGRLLGGTGSFGAVRTALAWGLAPQVWALVYRLPYLLLWPEKMGGQQRVRTAADFQFTAPDLSAGGIAYGFLELGVLMWYLIVGSRALAEAQGISSLRGMANLLLAVVLPVVVMIVVTVAAFLAMRTT